jgi:uncharacterized repeat protein (TIGR03806 family)
MKRLLRTLVLLAPAGCAAPIPPDVHAVKESRPEALPYLNMPADGNGPVPVLLSQTGAFADVRTLTPSPALLSYELNVSFWSDGASKRRWVSLPHGTAIRFALHGAWSFPAGTVFVKHFEADGRRLETRLLVREAAGGVYGASYKWRADNSDAELVTEARFEGGWYYPGRDDCRKCHTVASGGVLGVNAKQLNRDVTGAPGAESQLRRWERLGMFAERLCIDPAQVPSLARADDEAHSLEDRARAYLDVNCAMCHRPGGAAADFDARYETPLERQLMIDVPARINLGLDRARFVAPRDPWRSVILARMTTLEQIKMPPLGHETIDRAGIELLRRWIMTLPGPPVAAPPTITPKGGDFPGPVRVTLSHPDPAAALRYTLDGSAPTAKSALYAGPLELKGPTTLRARAFKDGETRSIAVTETYIVE